MTDALAIMIYAGGAAGAEMAGVGFWRTAFWPYFAGRALAGLAFAPSRPGSDA